MVFCACVWIRTRIRGRTQGMSCLIVLTFGDGDLMGRALEFDYEDVSEEIELRVRCRRYESREHDDFSMRIDRISVLYIGKLRVRSGL